MKGSGARHKPQGSQSGVSANAENHMHARYKQMRDTRPLEGTSDASPYGAGMQDCEERQSNKLRIGLLSRVKTTPQKTCFRSVKFARIWDTDRVDDHSDKNTIDDTKHKINT